MSERVIMDIPSIHHQFAAFFKAPVLEPVLYELSRKLTEGHICIDPTEMDQSMLKEAGFDSLPTEAQLLESPLVGTGEANKPFIYEGSRLYMQRYYYYETLILDRIKSFVELEKQAYVERLAALQGLGQVVKALFAPRENERTEQVNWQWMAALTTVLHDFSIITGGPGTGKTTTVAKVLSLLLHLNPALKILLCAPTGKAAARMAESLRQAGNDSEPFIKKAFEGLAPSTIHRLLGTQLGRPTFKHNKDRPVEADVIIVDEASMIDVALMAKLMDATGAGTRLILLGDKDQLASVEAGSLFGDLCKSLSEVNHFSAALLDSLHPLLPGGAILPPAHNDQGAAHLLFEHIVELKISHRFSDQKGIGKFSKAILNNDPVAIRSFFENQDPEVQVDSIYDDEVFEAFVLGYEAFIKESDILTALQKLGRLRVLAAVRETRYGVETLNLRIERILKNKGLLRPNETFYQNRPIMVTRNNPQLGLFNGDIGILRKDADGVMKAWFESADGSLKSVLPGFIGGEQTAFAMTIHKSQGSEFQSVLVILPPPQQARGLTRELLYTAVTRARERVVLQAPEEVTLESAAAVIHRGSGVISRLDPSN